MKDTRIHFMPVAVEAKVINGKVFARLEHKTPMDAWGNGGCGYREWVRVYPPLGMVPETDKDTPKDKRG